MGKHFGELATIRGIVYYKLSPHEQKPFAGAIKYGLPNFLPRTLATLYTWLPPMVLGYMVYEYCEYSYHASKRKNLQDYANEVDPNPEPVCKPAAPKPKKCGPKGENAEGEE